MCPMLGSITPSEHYRGRSYIAAAQVALRRPPSPALALAAQTGCEWQTDAHSHGVYMQRRKRRYLRVQHLRDEAREQRGGARRGQRAQQRRGRVVHHLAHQRQARAPHARAARAHVARAEHRHQAPAATIDRGVIWLVTCLVKLNKVLGSPTQFEMF